MQTGVVIPVGTGRLQNLLAVLESIENQTVPVTAIVVIVDGDAPDITGGLSLRLGKKIPFAVLETPKHEPGMEQPRNIGVRLLDDLGARDERMKCTHAWFLDSDVILTPTAHAAFQDAYQRAEAWRCPTCGHPDNDFDPDVAHCDNCGFEGEGPSAENNWTDGWIPAHSIFVGPYDWLPPGVREPQPDLRNDPDGVPPPGRWGRFDENDPDRPVVNDIFAGLACFSGNLVWPIEEFKRIGGFWDEIHHGRCEDGELGVRAVSMGVPITFVRDARGWHLWHERNMDWILAANQRDIPMLDERHPALKDEGLFVVDADGNRFDYTCKECGETMNAALSWGHRLAHEQEEPEKHGQRALDPGAQCLCGATPHPACPRHSFLRQG